MTEKKTSKISLMVIFLAVIFFVAPAQIIFERSQDERPLVLEVFTQKPTRTTIRAFEKEMEEASWLAQRLRPQMQFLRWAILHDTGPKAFLGKRKWFFYQPTVQYAIESLPRDTNGSEGMEQIIKAIISFRDQLAQRGIVLVVMIAPNKVSIYPDKLTGQAKPGELSVSYHTEKLIARIKQAKVEFVDLFELYKRARVRESTESREYYLTQDSHWSPEGMRAAARAVAEKILNREWVTLGSVEFESKPIKIRRHGDVLRMIQAEAIKNRFLPEEILCHQVIRKDTGELYRDDPGSDILILGDSFLRIYERDEPGSAGFVAHLAYELKKPMASIINDGGASTLVRQDLSRRIDLLDHKKLVLWEIVERDIRFGMEGWQTVILPEKAGPGLRQGESAF